MRYPEFDPANAGKHDFDGEYLGLKGCRVAMVSVGIFRLVLKVDGKGFKRSAVIARVRGGASQRSKIVALATQRCERLDCGETLEKKSWTVQ